MTRPEIERILEVFDWPGAEPHFAMIADLCRYVLALEAARDAVLPVHTYPDGVLRFDPSCLGCLRDRFDAAVARWKP